MFLFSVNIFLQTLVVLSLFLDFCLTFVCAEILVLRNAHQLAWSLFDCCFSFSAALETAGVLSLFLVFNLVPLIIVHAKVQFLSFNVLTS